MEIVTWRKASALAGLKGILIPDLELGECAEGKVIFGVISAEASLVHDLNWGVASKVRDAASNEMTIEVGFALKHGSSQQEVDAAFPKGARVAIKEPFLLAPSERFFRDGPRIAVCNPLCIEFLGVEDALIDGDGHCELRMKGNLEFKRRKFLMASLYYGECLRLLHGVPEMEKDRLLALSNRAQAYLNLGRLDEALVDAEMAVEIDPHHSKSWARMAKAFAGMQEHERAVECLERALEHCLPEEAADIQRNLDMSRAMLKQSMDGIFDISGFILGGSRHDMAPPLSDFVGPLEIRLSEETGKGLFVTEDVRLGDVLFASNALGRAVASPEAARLNDANAKMLLDVDTGVEMIRACTGSYRLNLQLRGVVVDDFVPGMAAYRPNSGLRRPPEAEDEEFYSALAPRRIELALRRHAIAETQQHRRPTWCGVWGLPGLINHSCVSNISVVIVGRGLVVRAARDIKAGEELVQSYFECSRPLSRRREIIAKEFRFVCKCRRCTIESELAEKLKDNTLIKTWASKTQVAITMVDVRATLEHLEMVLATTELSCEEKEWVRGSFWELYEIPGVVLPEVAMRILRASGAGFVATIHKLLAIYTSVLEPSPEAWVILEQECFARFGRVPRSVLHRIVRKLVE